MFASILAGKPRPAGGSFNFPGTLSLDEMTADFIYIRFHGPLKSPYSGAYPDEFLKEWTGTIQSWMKAVKAVYVYFDNTMQGHAAVDALKMQLLLGKTKNTKVSHEGMKQ
jgi:uncharacterized protein YecE (DUF72 family)